MKVLLVNTLYPPDSVGGAERSVAQLAQGLKAKGATVSVLALQAGRDATVETRDGIKVHRLPLRNLYWPYDGRRRSALQRAVWHGVEAFNPLMIGGVRRVLKAVKPDILHAHVMTGFSLSVFQAARAIDAPLVLTLRDYDLMCARSALFRNGRRCRKRCGDCVALTAAKGRCADRSDAVVAISAAVLEAHRGRGRFRTTSTRVIGNAARAVSPTPRPTLEQAPTLTFGFLGRIEPEKGIEVLLAASRRLEGHWRLKVAGVGEADYVARLKKTYSDTRVDWLGAVQADRFFADIDVLTAPALWEEPFGRVVVEALAYGRSVIASRVGGLPEAAAGGACVALTPPGDVDALARAMAEAFAAPDIWRFAGGTGHGEGWTDAGVAAAHMALYRDILEARAARVSADRPQS